MFLLQVIFHDGHQGEIVQVGIEQPAHGAGVDRGVQPDQEPPQIESAPAGGQQRRDQAIPAGLAIGREPVEFERLRAGFAAYAGIIGNCAEVLTEFFPADSFSMASIFSRESGASITSSRNSVHSSTR